MKKIIVTLLVLSLLLIPAVSFSKDDNEVFVKGYYRKNGTWVAPHYRTKANGTKDDNWSTKGNRNPYTGKKGSVNKSLSKELKDKYGIGSK